MAEGKRPATAGRFGLHYADVSFVSSLAASTSDGNDYVPVLRKANHHGDLDDLSGHDVDWRSEGCSGEAR